MTTRAYYHPRDLVVDLADLTREMYDEIASLHGKIDPPPADPVLTCLGNNEPMYVWRHESGRYFVRHFPNGNADGHAHRAIATMSDEHLRQAEYSQRAAAREGFDARLEVSTGNHTRVDVGIFSGLGNIGLEIQRSQLSTPKAKSRATRSFMAGWSTAWISDSENDPAWLDYVPTARLTSRGGWDEALPPPNSAYISISMFRRERSRNAKSGYRYVREPRAVLLDELAYLMPAGEIVPVTVGTKGHVVLAERAAREVIDSCTYPGASEWNPVLTVAKVVKESAQTYSRHCHHQDSVSLRIPKREIPEVREPIPALTPFIRPHCGCGEPLLAPISIVRGFCERCRIDGKSWNRRC